MIIEINPGNKKEIIVDGVVYEQKKDSTQLSEGESIMNKINETFDFSRPQSEWRKMSAEEIFISVFGYPPNDKATGFGIKLTRMAIFKKGKSGSKRFYIVPPLHPF